MDTAEYKHDNGNPGKALIVFAVTILLLVLIFSVLQNNADSQKENRYKKDSVDNSQVDDNTEKEGRQDSVKKENNPKEKNSDTSEVTGTHSDPHQGDTPSRNARSDDKKNKSSKKQMGEDGSSLSPELDTKIVKSDRSAQKLEIWSFTCNRISQYRKLKNRNKFEFPQYGVKATSIDRKIPDSFIVKGYFINTDEKGIRKKYSFELEIGITQHGFISNLPIINEIN